MDQPMVHLAADNGAAMAYASGSDILNWQAQDLRQLDIELLFDGEVVSEGLPLAARCDERWALVQTINHFSARGTGTARGRGECQNRRREAPQRERAHRVSGRARGPRRGADLFVSRSRASRAVATGPLRAE